MPTLPVPNSGEIGVLFTDLTGSTQCELTFPVRDVTGNIFANATAFLGDVWAAVLAHLVPGADYKTAFNAVALADLRTVPSGGLTVIETATQGTGVPTGDPVPTSCCIAIERRATGLGRSFRGRVYWPIWCTSWLSGQDYLSGAAASGIATHLAAFQAAVEGGTYPCEFGIISRQLNKVQLDPPVFRPVTSWVAGDVYIDSQRRRLTGRGS